jgi:6-pyruvoyltetrahydropterin/6-carboxytetrahydropterin synthase
MVQARYTVYKQVEFAASHFLREYHGQCEQLHGHNYLVRVYVGANELDSEGMVVDFVKLKAAMNEVITRRFDHRHVNDVPPFDKLHPTAENLARHFAEEIAGSIDDNRVRVTECRVYETQRNCAIYRR